MIIEICDNPKSCLYQCIDTPYDEVIEFCKDKQSFQTKKVVILYETKANGISSLSPVYTRSDTGELMIDLACNKYYPPLMEG